MLVVSDSFSQLDIEIRKHPSLDIYCSADGRVWRHTSKRKETNRLSRGTLVSGYYMMRVGKGYYLVHRLIAEAFLANDDNKPTVDHINRIKTDNRINNLRWADLSEQANNRDFVINRHEVEHRSKDNLTAYTRERRKYVREHGVGYGKQPIIDDEEHRKSRERNARYRERHKERIKQSNHEFYLRRKANASIK